MEPSLGSMQTTAGPFAPVNATSDRTSTPAGAALWTSHWNVTSVFDDSATGEPNAGVVRLKLSGM